MSALTKIFVVLVVLLSIIQTAGMVVWINRSQNFTAEVKRLKADIDAKQSTIAGLDGQVKLVSGERDQIRTIMQAQIDLARTKMEDVKKEFAGKDDTIARLNAENVQIAAASKSSSDALAVAQKTIGEQSKSVDDLRKSELALQQRLVEQSLAINDWTNKWQVTDRQARDYQEQITQLGGDNQKLRDTLHRAGIKEAGAQAMTGGESLLRVEGVIRKAENIQGIPFATISVGSADQVTKGMQFKVIDPKSPNPFLGYLTVDRVEPNEASGQLTGPRVNLVHPGVEVHTQL